MTDQTPGAEPMIPTVTADLPAVTRTDGDAKDLVRAIAMDIGKEVVAHIETMYPAAIAACPSTFPLSVRNTVFNEIMAAIKVNDEGQIIARLKQRKTFRRKMKAAYQKIRRES